MAWAGRRCPELCSALAGGHKRGAGAGAVCAARAAVRGECLHVCQVSAGARGPAVLLAGSWVVAQLAELELSLCRCQQKVSASKGFSIHQAANVLTVALKRFAPFGGGKITKVSAWQARAEAVSWPKLLLPRAGWQGSCAQPELCHSPAALAQLCGAGALWLLRPPSSAPPLPREAACPSPGRWHC